jgi:hypothetical protein
MAADQSRSEDVVPDDLGDSLGADSWVLDSGCYSGGRPQTLGRKLSLLDLILCDLRSWRSNGIGPAAFNLEEQTAK